MSLWSRRILKVIINARKQCGSLNMIVTYGIGKRRPPNGIVAVCFFTEATIFTTTLVFNRICSTRFHQ